jgi:hypothetical protein
LAAGGPVNSQSTAWAVQGLIAAGVDPGGVRRHGRSGLDFLAAQRSGDGHYRYSSSSDQTPVWVTGQALVASEQESFPIPAVARASSTAAGSAGEAGSARGSGASKGRDGAAGNGGGRPIDTGRFGKEQGRPQRDAGSGGSNGTAAKQQTSGAQAPEGNPRPAGAADEGSDGDSSPLVPIGIGLAAAIVVLGGGWLASRRLTARE